MTAQIPDSFEYQSGTYELVAVRGSSLFEPEAHGLRPVMMHTACARGYYATYAIEHRQLVVRALAVQLAPEDLANTGGRYPQLNGVTAKKGKYGEHKYQGLNLPVPFTGGILIADDFIEELYVHMGFHPAWKYERVHELSFASGQLEHARDCSDVAAQVRQRMRKEGRGEGFEQGESLVEWIRSTFELRYPW